MSDERPYTIGELAEAAGVTPRTIRYYTAEGLLPKPDARGQYAQYGGDHLLRLRLIARLKDAYLPLSEIRAHLAPLGTDEVRALLNELPAPEPAGAPPSSAADYIAQLLDSRPPQLAEPPARYEYQPGIQPMAVLPGRELPAPAPAYGFAAPAPAEPARPEGRLRRLLARRGQRPAAEAPPEERWRRFVIAPGVELHIRDESALRARAERLITLARELFAGDA